MSHFDDQPTVEPGAREPEQPPSTHFPYPINSRYRCIELIGHGSSGAVYRAFDSQLQRDVAIKFIHHQQLSERRRLIAEGRVLAQLDHPNICKVYEVAEEGDAVYLVMSFINGSHLSSWRTHFTRAQHVELVAQVCAALQTAHANGVVHCDVKPTNIVLRENAQEQVSAVLVDFGVAHSDSHASYQSGAGTHRYMAPERFQDAAATLTPASDIYSMGATLRYLLTGEHRTDALHKLPTDLRLIINQALQADPKQRYASMQHLHDDLRAWQQGQPISLRRSPAYRLRRLWQRSPWLRGTSVSAAALAAVLVIAAATYQDTLRQRQVEEVNIRENVALTVNEIDAIYRAPAHNRKASLDQLHAQADEWFAQAASQPDWLAAANYSAAGRIFVQLDEFDKAQRALTRAWELGERSQRTAMALAKVSVRFYLIADSQARNLTSVEQREAALAEARKEFQQPGLEYLQLAAGSQLPRDYMRAMRAYLNNEPDRALNFLWQGNYPVWFYQRYDFIMRIQSNRLFNRLLGRSEGDYQPILSDLETAHEKLNALTPSNASPYFLMALVYNEVSAQRTHTDDEEARLDRLFAEQIERIRELDPTHPHAYHFLALRQASLVADANEGGAVALERAKRAARYSEQALAEAKRREWPKQQQVRLVMSAVDRTNALVRALQNQALATERAVSRYFVLADQVPEAHRGARFNLNLARAHQARALEIEQGPEATEHWQLADAAHTKARAIAPTILGFHANHANMLNQWAPRTDAPHANELLIRALEAIQMVSAKAPGNTSVQYIQGRVSLNAALIRAMLPDKQGAEVLFQQAEKAFETALEISPSLDFARQQISRMAYLYNELRADPLPPGQALDKAEQILMQESRPNDGNMFSRLLPISYGRWQLDPAPVHLDTIKNYADTVESARAMPAYPETRHVLYSLGIAHRGEEQAYWFERAADFEPPSFDIPVSNPRVMNDAVLQTYAAYTRSSVTERSAGLKKDLQALCIQSNEYKENLVFFYPSYLPLRDSWQLIAEHSDIECPAMTDG
ncbi:protein kinase domain-containing protein [Aliidiomarina sp. Khilg15.8]